jgi:beta-L-arabinobiosidase
VVLISWVAPEAYEADGSVLSLIEVTFEGQSDAIEATGAAHDAEGNALPIGTVDTSALEEAIAKAEELKAEDYTQETWEALQEELKAAEKVLEDPTATQAEVDEAAAALEEAIAALEEYVEPSKPTEPTEPEVTVDKSELEKAVKDAGSKVKKDYTKKSWDAMQAALKVAQKVLKDEDATQEEVDNAADALNKAIKALVPTTGKNPGTGDETRIVLVFAIGTMALVGMGTLVVMNSRNKKKGGK